MLFYITHLLLQAFFQNGESLLLFVYFEIDLRELNVCLVSWLYFNRLLEIPLSTGYIAQTEFYLSDKEYDLLVLVDLQGILSRI